MKNRVVNQHVLRAISIGLAAFIATTTPVTVLAAEESEAGSDTDTKEDSGSESKSETTTHESSEKASSASSEAKKAQSSAESSSKTASEKSEEAKSEASKAKDAAEEVNGNKEKKSDMTGAAETAEAAVQDAEDAAQEAYGKESGSTEENADSAEKLGEAIDKNESDTSEIVETAEESRKETEAVRQEIQDNFDKVFSDDATITEEERQEAAKAVIEASNKIGEKLQSAVEKKEKAETNVEAAKQNYNVNAIIYGQATLGEWDEETQTFGTGAVCETEEEAKNKLIALIGEENASQWFDLINENYTQGVGTGNGTVQAAVEEAESAIKTAEAIMDSALADYNTAKAAYEEAAADAAEAKDAAIEAAKKAELTYDIAKEAAGDAAKAKDAKDITKSEEENLYDAQLTTAKAVLASRESAEKAVEAVKEAEAEREAVENALNQEVRDAQQKLTDAKKDLADLQRRTLKYNTPKAFEKMILDIANAQKAVNEAQAELDAAEKEAKEFAKYAAYYTGDNTERYISDRNISVYAQLTSDGKDLAKSNEKNFDVEDEAVKSRSVKYFTMVSKGLKSVKVPDSIYRAYLKALAETPLEVSTGTGIATGPIGDAVQAQNATMPVIYWEIKDDQLTGKYYSDITYQPTGDYFVGYVFKREGLMKEEGYHIDGVLIHHEKGPELPDEEIPDVPGDWDPEKPETPTTPDTTPGGGSGGSGGGSGSGTPVVTITDDPVSLSDMIDQAAIEILDAPVALAASAPDEVLIDDEGVPLADSIPQTGDNAVSVMPVAATGITALMAAFFMGKRKKEDR